MLAIACVCVCGRVCIRELAAICVDMSENWQLFLDTFVCVCAYLCAVGLMKVLFWLLHPDPRSRATIKDLQKDKWTNQPLDDSLLNFDCVFGKSYETAVNPWPTLLCLDYTKDVANSLKLVFRASD